MQLSPPLIDAFDRGPHQFGPASGIIRQRSFAPIASVISADPRRYRLLHLALQHLAQCDASDSRIGPRHAAIVCRIDFSVNRSTGLLGPGRLGDQEAGRSVAGRDLVERRRLLAAAVERVRAAGMEGASRRGVDR